MGLMGVGSRFPSVQARVDFPHLKTDSPFRWSRNGNSVDGTWLHRGIRILRDSQSVASRMREDAMAQCPTHDSLPGIVSARHERAVWAPHHRRFALLVRTLDQNQFFALQRCNRLPDVSLIVQQATLLELALRLFFNNFNFTP